MVLLVAPSAVGHCVFSTRILQAGTDIKHLQGNHTNTPTAFDRRIKLIDVHHF
jgi:hypothetical protein